jgi:hypothetical protein
VQRGEDLEETDELIRLQINYCGRNQIADSRSERDDDSTRP